MIIIILTEDRRSSSKDESKVKRLGSRKTEIRA